MSFFFLLPTENPEGLWTFSPPASMIAVMATWHVYILRCADGSLYTGCTNDLELRLAAHNAGKGAKYTASRRPVRIVYVEPAASKSAALKRELQIKRWGKSRKEALIRSGKEAPDPRQGTKKALSDRNDGGLTR